MEPKQLSLTEVTLAAQSELLSVCLDIRGNAFYLADRLVGKVEGENSRAPGSADMPPQGYFASLLQHQNETLAVIKEARTILEALIRQLDGSKKLELDPGASPRSAMERTLDEMIERETRGTR